MNGQPPAVAGTSGEQGTATPAANQRRAANITLRSTRLRENTKRSQVIDMINKLDARHVTVTV